MDFVEEALERFRGGKIGQGELFSVLFSPDILYEKYVERFKKSPAKGLDRMNGIQFYDRAVDSFVVSGRKIAEGSFRFTAYLERLKNKGRTKVPRVIGIPTIRDRVILSQLNTFLSAIFPQCVARNVASGYVREISRGLPSMAPSETWVCGTDIKSFYDDIDRLKLMIALSLRVDFSPALVLINHAICTPIVPAVSGRAARKQYMTKKGVPQGLAISNILAAIYVEDVDRAINSLPVSYFRYVDDILIYGGKDHVYDAYATVKDMMAERGLELHGVGSGKTSISTIDKEFGYLGYVFKLPVVTVRDVTVERFLQSMAAKFTDFRLGKNSLIKKFDYLDESRVKDIFLLELNEKITGAVSDGRRYGWISYFNQINDFQLLSRMDVIISRMFKRLPEFGRVAPPGLKKIHRSYYEMKYRPHGGYVHSYDIIEDRTQKLVFLVERGRIGPKETLTDDEISKRFDSYRARILKEMHADEGVIY